MPTTLTNIASAIARSFEKAPFMWAVLALAIASFTALFLVGILRPSRIEATRRDVSPHPAILWLGAAAVILTTQIIAASFLHAIPALAANPDSARTKALTNLLSLLAAAIMAACTLRLAHASAPKAGLTVRAGDLPRGALAFLLLLPILLITSHLGVAIYTGIRGDSPPFAAHQILRMYQDEPGNPWIWTLLAGAVLLAPIVEEIMYRALLQATFLKLTNRVWASILATSLIFTAMHIDGADVPWHALPTLLVLSTGLGIAYERTGRLGVPIAMHALFNATNVALMIARG